MSPPRNQGVKWCNAMGLIPCLDHRCCSAPITEGGKCTEPVLGSCSWGFLLCPLIIIESQNISSWKRLTRIIKSKHRRFRMNIRKHFCTVRVTEHRTRLPRVVVESPSLELSGNGPGWLAVGQRSLPISAMLGFYEQCWKVLGRHSTLFG